MGCFIRAFVLSLVGLVVLAFAPSAGAVTFTSASTVYWNPADLPALAGGTPTATDTASGFTLTGDLQVLTGFHTFSVDRAFSIGPLPERVTFDASENWKSVVSGGSPVPTLPSVLIGPFYALYDLQTGGNITRSSPTTFTQTGNGTHIADALLADVFAPNLPVDYILTPGNYRIELLVAADFSPGNPSALSPGAFLEFGGFTDFTGFSIDVTGTPVPEPTSVSLLAAGLAGLACCARRRR